MDASELIIAEPVSILGLGLSQPDFPVAEVNSGGEAEASNVLADAGFDGATSEPFASVEEDSEDDEEFEDDEESQKFGDLSCPSNEPFYFAPAPSESSSKRGREVSRHDVAFMRGKPRLMSLWEGESKGPVVDLVSKCSDREEDGYAGGSVAIGGGSKRKRRDSRNEDTRSKSRGTEARKVEVDTTTTMFRVFCILIVSGALSRIMLRGGTIWWQIKSRRMPCAPSVQCGGRRAGFSA